MTNYRQKDIITELRYQLRMSEQEIPNLKIVDSHLWIALQNAAISYDQTELPWIDLGANLTTAIKKASSDMLGNLAESAVCSFTVDMSPSDFSENFGRRQNWEDLQEDIRINYHQARFSAIYWGGVRDFAIKSKIDCQSAFHIPMGIIETISECSTGDIIDFCHGYTHLQRFRLMSSQNDCLLLLNLARNLIGNNGSQSIKFRNSGTLRGAKLQKSYRWALTNNKYNGGNYEI